MKDVKHNMSEVFEVNNLRIQCPHIESVDLFRRPLVTSVSEVRHQIRLSR